MKRFLSLLGFLFVLTITVRADEQLDQLQSELAKPDLNVGQKASLLYQIGARQSELGMGEEAATTFAKVLTEHPAESGVVLATVRHLVLAKKILETQGYLSLDLSVSMHDKLRDMIVPKICFNKTPVHEAFSQLKELSKELDPDGIGVNFLTILRSRAFSSEEAIVEEEEEDFFADDDDDHLFGEGRPADKANASDGLDELVLPEHMPITCTFENISMLAIAQTICKLRGLKLKTEDYAIVILGPNVERISYPMRFVPVPAGLFENMSQQEVENFFVKRGVSFPVFSSGDKSFISYDRNTRKLILRHTFENADAIEDIVRSYYQPMPILTVTLRHVKLNQAFTPNNPISNLGIASELGRFQLMGQANASLSGSNIVHKEADAAGIGMVAEVKIKETDEQRQYQVDLLWENGKPAKNKLQTTVSLYPEVPLALAVPGRIDEALIVTLQAFDQSDRSEEYLERQRREQRALKLLMGNE